jgi:hypothetical protein
MMYVKVFRSIFDGSLYGHFEATIVFLAMLVVADKDGAVDMTAEKLAAECGYPLDIVNKGIAELCAPDERSRTPDEDGRRLTVLHEAGWGWQIVNYAKYREIRTAEERREYFKEHKRKQRAKSKDVHNVHRSPPESTGKHPSEAEAEAEAEADSEKSKTHVRAVHAPAEPVEFAEVRQKYPRRAGGQRWGDAAKFYARRRAEGVSHEVIMAGVERYAAFARASGDEGTRHIQQAATFLGDNRGYLEPWRAPPPVKQLSAVERAIQANQVNHDERVVSQQNGSGGGDVDGLDLDVWQPLQPRLRRLGS